MKKTILSISICMAIAGTNARAASFGLTNEGTPSKKNSPVVHNILSDKLPAKLLASIKKEYASYWITSLYKETVSGKVSYHITVENPDQVVKLTAARPANWVVEQVVPKDQAAF